jgi:hypothetical protein
LSAGFTLDTSFGYSNRLLVLAPLNKSLDLATRFTAIILIKRMIHRGAGMLQPQWPERSAGCQCARYEHNKQTVLPVSNQACEPQQGSGESRM